MSDLTPFTFPATGQPVRTVLDGDDFWFVATDVGAILGLTNVRSSIAVLDEDERGVHTMDTAAGLREYTVISESGLYSLILRSRKAEAQEFKRWVTREVLPQIRKTGRYEAGPRFAIPTSFAEALELAARQAREIEASEQRIAELAPAAESWETLAAANGDYSVADAAKVLSRDPGIQIGRDRLFTVLARLGWTYRGGDGRWRIKQSAVETGRLSEMPSSHYHPRTGELVLDPPQVRVTVKGVHDLRQALGAREVAVSS